MKNIKENLPALTFDWMASTYEIITALILKTPLWIFDNTWFDNTTYLFSLIAISVVTILTSIEGMKRMCKKESMDIQTIAKRWFIVAGLSTIVPYLFKKGFQALNWVSEKIIGLSSHSMTNVLEEAVAPFDLFVLLLFNIVMIGVAIPILLKNAKRFFDILTLSVLAPMAGVAWIFNSYNHLFKQWWANLKDKSLVQIVYAFYLLLIGLFIYGVPTPPTTTGSLIKILMVIGGFYRLVDPPNILHRQMNHGQSIMELGSQVKKSTNKVKDGYKLGHGITKNSAIAFKKFMDIGKPVVITKPNTRMSRNHGK
ncbi:hypothetical protein [Aquibacillus saliphilus]|uniref:hypothetical protein n=1 Tax=Aquibacillus saliphilus TaxID=1909422 RepID=UPI001CF04E22|nr:hypothetical protein [Aquibacillus saliphilus]